LARAVLESRLEFLLFCPCCQAPFSHFFLLFILSLRNGFTSDALVVFKCLLVSHMSMYCSYFGASKVSGDPGFHLWHHTRCFQSHGLDPAGGFLWRGDPSSPTTFYPCGLLGPSPDSLCVFRRELESLEEATPSIRRLAWQARNSNGLPPPAPQPKCDSASTKGLCLFEHRSLRQHPRLKRLPPLP
jgi:hypothetical protein